MKNLLILVVSLLFLAGCSARRQIDTSIDGILSGEPVIPRNANSIALTVTSKDNSFCDQYYLRQKLAERLSLSGRLAIVERKAQADVHLSVTCLGYFSIPVLFDSVGNISRYRIGISAHVVLYDMKKDKVIFDDNSVQAHEEFSDTVHPMTTSHDANNRLARTLAERLKKKTVTGWYTELMTSEEKRSR